MQKILDTIIGVSIKILVVNFSISILDNSKLDKISEGIAKKNHIWNRVRLPLRGKKVTVNQMLFSKLDT